MFKNYLKGIDGIASYPVFSLVVFFVFFISLAVWLVLANKKRMEEISQLPLDETQKDFASFNQAQNYETSKRN